jgi:acyl-[acyl-carrier-protein]-phospholipid O-acyltransferase/long-chain-fatty-acid--[acyl-carrier-protein] ligase
VILPPGIAGTLANLGLLFAGKVPVNLNPTLSESAAHACIEQAGIVAPIWGQGPLCSRSYWHS